MLLQRLVEYTHRPDIDLAPPMYNEEPVRYWIELDVDGRYVGLVSVEGEDGRPKRVSVPTLVRAFGIRPKLLADNGEYVLGIPRPEGKPGRVAECHQRFVDLTRTCEGATNEPAVTAVLRFLEELDVATLGLPQDFDPTANISFRVDGEIPSDLPSVRAFWERAAAEGNEMQCLVCGRTLPAMERLQVKMKGIPGGQTAGLALISANKGAFTSYGLDASYGAPTCLGCSDRFMKAANKLIFDPSTHLRIGNAKYIFWTREHHPFSPVSMLSGPKPDDVQDLLKSAFTARAGDLDPTPFYAAALSASGARAVVRDWIDTTVGRAKQNLGRFFLLGNIVDSWGQPGVPHGILGLARGTVRSGSKDDPAPWASKALLHCALAGGPLPITLLYKATERSRAENGVTATRAALIKLVLLSRDENHIPERERLVELDTANLDASYLCGRLFAELEAVQRSALGKVGANIVDRYYGTASSAPATVFGRLVRGAQPHLGKLRRDRPGAYFALDARLQEILEHLETFPTTLTLEKQGTFALGYYHQRAADRKAVRGNRELEEDEED